MPDGRMLACPVVVNLNVLKYRRESRVVEVVTADQPASTIFHTLVMTSRDVLALASALNLDENRLAHEATKVTEQSSAPPIWTVCWILVVIVLTWWIFRMAIDDSTPVINQFQPVIEGSAL